MLFLVWKRLPVRGAYKYLDTVRSGNRLQEIASEVQLAETLKSNPPSVQAVPLEDSSVENDEDESDYMRLEKLQRYILSLEDYYSWWVLPMPNTVSDLDISEELPQPMFSSALETAPTQSDIQSSIQDEISHPVQSTKQDFPVIRSLPDLIVTEGLERLSQYEYKSLQREAGEEIRILTILPDSEDQPFRCRLVASDFNRPYEAISYVWDYEEPQTTIFISSINLNSEKTATSWSYLTIDVPTNLDVMLRNFRQPDKEVHVWLDAICMVRNQKLKSQVDHKDGAIYKHTQRVWIWLGEEASLTTRTFSWIQEFSEARSFMKLSSTDVPQSLLGLELLFYNRCFKHVLVIPEIALAKQGVLCWRRHELLWNDFKAI